MLPIPNTPLDPNIAAELAAFQSELDAFPTYAERVAQAQILYKKYSQRKTFTRGVRNALKALCGNLQRCMYCEDSCGTDIEHHHPKDFYPERTFLWENLLYACVRCNRPKSVQFEVFSHATGRRVKIVKTNPLIEPEPGDPLLIDPRKENPMDFLALDIRGTFLFFPASKLSDRDRQRAEYTRTILHLNDDPLPSSRRDAYENYLARLDRYTQMQTKREREKAKRSFQKMMHRTVWEEIKRRRRHIPELERLFERAPEALDW